MKTSELTGAALDWAVVYAQHDKVLEPAVNYWLERYVDPERRYMCESPSINWSQGGPIIERESINLVKMHGHEWHADCGKVATGPTPLIAAMRCYVASKLGDEVEIPEELKCTT